MANRLAKGFILRLNALSLDKIPSSQAETVSEEMEMLIKAVRAIPYPYREQVSGALAPVQHEARRNKRKMTLLEDALAQIRFDMKFLVFDLEATRRERDALQQKLNELGE